MTETCAKTENGGNPREVRLTRDERGRLVFQSHAGAPPVTGVSVARCFPWSFHNGYFSIRDAEGREVCLLRSLDDVAPPVRELIEVELRAQEFIPRITEVEEVDDRFDVMAWKVKTDRGPIELQVRHAEDLLPLGDGRVLIRDHAGGLFETPPLTELDPRSRRLLENHLG